jgi:hypothetical protein
MSRNVRIALGAFYLATTVIMVAAFRRFPNQSLLWASEWIALYVVGLVVPALSTYRLAQRLKRQGVNVEDMQFALVTPALFAGLAVLMALNLLRSV